MLSEGVLKLGDFGFSKILKDEDLAQTHIGTPYYMAPEILEWLQYDSKADVWSLGVCFYELLFAKVPFRAQSFAGLLPSIK